LTFTALGLSPTLDQKSELLLAGNDRHRTADVPCRKPTLKGALGEHRKSRYRSGETLQFFCSKLLEHEQITDESASRFCDDYYPGFRSALEACCEIWSVANDRLLLSRALADKVADDHETGRNANSDSQVISGGGS
jgi:hypothetical protein